MPNDLSGAIIAAGRGERLRSATGGLPKPLVEVGGQTLLERQVNLMLASGLRPVHAIINSETAHLAAAHGLCFPRELDLTIADTPSSMESLLRLGERIRAGNFVLTTVDALVRRPHFLEFVECARAELVESKGRCDGLLGIVRWRGDERPLFVTRAADGSISGFDGPAQEWVTAGIYAFNTRIFDFAETARRRGLDALRRFLAMLLEHRMRLKTHELPEALDLDRGEDLTMAKLWLEGAA